MGNKWSKISLNLAGRTDNSIKNHWNSMMRKKIPEFKEKLDSILVKKSAKNSKNLQAEIINELLTQEKLLLSREATRENITVRPVLLVEKEKKQLISSDHFKNLNNEAGPRKNSSSGSTLAEAGEAAAKKNPEPQTGILDSNMTSMFELRLHGRVPEMSLSDDFPLDEATLSGLHTIKKDSSRPNAFEDLFYEDAFLPQPSARIPYFSRDYSVNNSTEKAYTNPLFHHYYHQED